ncbi:VOC family protein [uncultured Paracoccus sp.]|uniref:VOC family protein n=1 Tax=uncultured Paracoccus sp. TaxID=189685 RepID=UPI0026191C23|nr:VOC family protein [uncultured Paracoccus sp.]
MPLRLDHLHIYATDPEAGAAGYLRLGARRVREVTTVNGLRIVLDLAGLNLFVEQSPDGSTGIDHLAMASDDLDSDLAAIIAEGGRILTGPREAGPGLRIAFAELADGQRAEVLQRGIV